MSSTSCIPSLHKAANRSLSEATLVWKFDQHSPMIDLHLRMDMCPVCATPPTYSAPTLKVEVNLPSGMRTQLRGMCYCCHHLFICGSAFTSELRVIAVTAPWGPERAGARHRRIPVQIQHSINFCTECIRAALGSVDLGDVVYPE